MEDIDTSRFPGINVDGKVYETQSAIHSQCIPARCLHSAEEHNWSPVDSTSLPCCQYIKINTNKYVYRQIPGWNHIGSGVELTECLLIIRTAYWVQLFLAWTSIPKSVCQPAFSLLSIRFQRRWSNPAFTKCRQLVSFRFYITPLPPLHQNKHRTICISPESGWNHIGSGV